MSKPLSEDAILVAKALKNFDPGKYCWFDVECCLGGQYTPPSDDKHNFEEFSKLSDIAKDAHDTQPIGISEGKKLKNYLVKKYNLAEV